MGNVWKVASRWSESGTVESSILDLFRRYNVVFVGKNTGAFQQISVGDLIAISDGRKVVAFGRAQSTAAPLPELAIDFSPEDLARFDYEDWVFGCRVSLVDLKEADYLHYRPSAFHAVRQRAEEFRELYTSYVERFEEHQEFEIAARSCTLVHNLGEPENVLWRGDITYRIPVYQRPYSWGETEVRRLVASLLTGYRGENGRPPEEPVFIGTMQITGKALLDGTSGQVVHEVIDGQQRVTTILLLLKVLVDHYSSTKSELGTLDLRSILETRVNGGAQQRYLNEALSCDTTSPFQPAQNPYLAALPTIQALLDDEAVSEDSGEANGVAVRSFDPQGFVRYLLSRVYFVVVETRASLSKTLQIFDTINTSGMDLNGGDIFKVRYYDFLKSKTNANEETFEAINGLYRKIDEKNRELGGKVCSIEDILSFARHVFVVRHNLPKTLHFSVGATLFFERFFDTVFGVGAWPEFSRQKCGSIELKIEEFDRWIDLRFEWESAFRELETEARMMLEFFWWSRYARYTFVFWLFRDRFGPDPDLNGRFIVLLSKLFTSFSIFNWRRVYEVDTIMNEILDLIAGPSFEATPADVFEKLEGILRGLAERLRDALLTHEIAWNAKTKGIACRLSAMIEEQPFDESLKADLKARLFETRIDIEHIQSYNPKDPNERKRIHKEWEGELNRIGNLIVLEESKNRSIGNGDYIERKLPIYGDSQFRIVRNHSTEFPDWDLEHCRKRKESETEKLVAYLCGTFPSAL